MRALALSAPHDVVHTTPRALFRPSVVRTRLQQQCYAAGSATAVAEADVLAADALAVGQQQYAAAQHLAEHPQHSNRGLQWSLQDASAVAATCSLTDSGCGVGTTSSPPDAEHTIPHSTAGSSSSRTTERSTTAAEAQCLPVLEVLQPGDDAGPHSRSARRRRLYQQLEMVVEQPLRQQHLDPPQGGMADPGQCSDQHQQEQQQQQQDAQWDLGLMQQDDLQQQQQQQQQQAAAAAASSEYQKNICRSLRATACHSVEQLQQIVAEHGQHMDAQALAASFTAAARLVKQPLPDMPDNSTSTSTDNSEQVRSQLVQLLEQQLLPLLQQDVRLMDAVGLQMVLYSLAALQYKQEVLVLGLEVAIAPVMHHLPLGRLCQLMWSLGHLGLRPQGQLVKNALRISGRHMSFLGALDLCQLLHGLVRLQVQPPSAWLDACCARVLQLCAHNQLGPRALCSVFHCLACLVSDQQQQQQQGQEQEQGQEQRQQLERSCPTVSGLPQPLLRRLLTATRQVLLAAAAVAEAEQPGLRRQQQQQQAAGLGHVHLWGAGQPEQLRLRQWPQQEPQQEPQQQPQKQHAGVQPQQQSHQQLTPQLQTQARFQQQQQQRLSPAGLVMLSDAARRLKLDPPPEWQAAFAAAARQLTPVADARNLPLMLAPLVRWRLVPDPAWLQQHLAACMGVLDCMRPQGLAVLGHSLAALRVRPSAAWLQAYLAAAQARRLTASPAGCSCIMHALGCWRQLGLLPAAGDGIGSAGATSGSSSGRQGLLHNAAAAAAGAAQRTDTAAAAGQQLQRVANQLAAECGVCFMEQHGRFTAEQLGMFCKGLAMWGRHGTPRLATCLEQAVLQLLNPGKIRRAARKQRVTAATLCNVLLALAVAGPAAATPVVMSQVWAAWSSAWLLPNTAAPQAAAAAWALTRLQQQPPWEFVAGLLQQLLLVEDVQLQHLAEVLLAAQRGGWEVRQPQVQALLGAMLQQHAAQLSALEACSSSHGRQQQQQQQEQQQQQRPAASTGPAPADAQHVLVHVYSSSDGSVQHSRMDGTGNTWRQPLLNSSTDSGGSTAAGGGLHGLTNQHAKGWLLAAEAAVAWCDVLSLQQCELAMQLCVSSAQLVPAGQGRQLQAHAQVLQAQCMQLGRGADVRGPVDAVMLLPRGEVRQVFGDVSSSSSWIGPSGDVLPALEQQLAVL